MGDYSGFFSSIFSFISFAFVIFGGWILHSRLHNRLTRIFFWLVVAIPAWKLLPVVVLRGVSDSLNMADSQRIWTLVAIVQLIDWLLLLAASVSFVFAIRTIERQPNNSFKPNPLRGSA